MAVWVLALNPFRKFYETLGGQIIAEQQIERGVKVFTEVAYGWSDLSRLDPVGPKYSTDLREASVNGSLKAL